MQRDSATYCDEPEDAADYAAWRSSSAYVTQACQAEIDKVLAGEASLGGGGGTDAGRLVCCSCHCCCSILGC